MRIYSKAVFMSKRKYFYCKKHIAFKSIKVVMLCPIKLQKTVSLSLTEMGQTAYVHVYLSHSSATTGSQESRNDIWIEEEQRGFVFLFFILLGVFESVQ